MHNELEDAKYVLYEAQQNGHISDLEYETKMAGLKEDQ